MHAEKTENYPLIAVVIVNFNGRDLTLEAIKSVKDSTFKTLRVIVVDNGSSDGSVRVINQAFPDVSIISNNENRGFAEGSNQGLAAAVEMRADYIMFMNNDAVVDLSCITHLADYLARDAETAAVAPYIFYYDRRSTIWFGGGDVKMWRGWIGHRHLREEFTPDSHEVAESDYLTGCIFLGRTGVLEKAGGFDTGFSLYAEDVDLSLRLRGVGWKLAVEPQAHGFHKVSATAGGELSPFKAYHRGRSSVNLVKRHVKIWEVPTLAVGGFFGAMYAVSRLLLSGRAGTAVALLKGMLDGMLNLAVPIKYQLKK